MALAAAEEAINDPAALKEPLTLFSPAYVLYQNGRKDEAVFWFYAAQLRARYQLVFEKGDRGQLLAIMMMTVGQPINNYAFQNIDQSVATLDRVLEWDRSTPNTFREKSKSEEETRQVEQIYAGLRELKAKLVTEKAMLEAQAQKSAPQIEQLYAQQKAMQCKEGQIDPAYVKQETDNEWDMAINFARNDQTVLRQVGTVKDAYPALATKKATDAMPSRYEVSVKGQQGKTVFVILDVSRSSGAAKFTLACTTALSVGYREAHKDVCAQ